MSQRWALLLQYDGTEFAGSQWQPNRPTVQGALQAALAQLMGREAAVSFAGRTDAGVHALGQTASFVSGQTAEQMPAHRWVRGINHFLPASVAVQAAAAVADDFDPRRAARSRTYVYQVRLARQRQPLWQRRAWMVPPPLCLETARRTLASLVGQHNFAPFTAPTDRSTIRTLHSAALDVEGESLRFRFRADSFLHHQVRRMVGAVVELAAGRLREQQFRQALECAAPGSLGPTAPAGGLTLVEVEYCPSPFGQSAGQSINQPTWIRDREGV